MATVGALSPPPLPIIEQRGLTEIRVHCDVDLSEAQISSINSRLQGAGLSPITNRRRQLRWAITGEDGGFWEFRIELYILTGSDSPSPLLHIMVIADKAVRTEPTAYRRSRRTVERIRSLVDAVFKEDLTAELECNMTCHTSTDSWLLPHLLPLNPDFPEESAIEEITGVIGGSADGVVKFVVDRVATNPMMFHIWSAFKHELPLSQSVLVEAMGRGISMLESIGVWE